MQFDELATQRVVSDGVRMQHAIFGQCVTSGKRRQTVELRGSKMCLDRFRWRRTCDRFSDSSSKCPTECIGRLLVEVGSWRERLQWRARRLRLCIHPSTPQGNAALLMMKRNTDLICSLIAEQVGESAAEAQVTNSASRASFYTVNCSRLYLFIQSNSHTQMQFFSTNTK